MTTIDYGSMATVDVCKRIRAALKRRTGIAFRVFRGRGTSSGWITIDVPDGRDDLRGQLADALGKDHVHHQGELVPGGHDYYREYIDRAEGRSPAKVGTPYWD